jgi:hypothetical protein
LSAPSVYPAINAISAELARSGIAKARVNEVDNYKYRSIDDVFERLAPLLATHRLCVLPRVIQRKVTKRHDDADHLLFSVALRVAFALTSAEDGSSHTIEVFGEALDGGDKATAKAMSAAYKSAMVQTFCIPVGDADDPDRTSHRLSTRGHEPEPVQGWTQWCVDIADIISVCESEQAISTVQERNRDLLKALSRERPELYAELGQSFLARREVLSPPSRRRPTKPARRGVRVPAITAEPKEHHG